MDIILLAILAGYLFYKLYQALGQDEEDEVTHHRRHAPLHPQTIQNDETQSRIHTQEQSTTEDGFDVVPFLVGAKQAFEIIIETYAKGDVHTLKPLLSRELYDLYVSAIEKRDKRKETLENTVDRIKSAEIIRHERTDVTLSVTVKFISEQVFVLRDINGQILEGDPDLMEEIVDIWTFSRDIRSKDPNWLLISSQARE